nr:MAG TPA: hypothetical protein [Caudoviricetes sp.]
MQLHNTLYHLPDSTEKILYYPFFMPHLCPSPSPCLHHVCPTHAPHMPHSLTLNAP